MSGLGVRFIPTPDHGVGTPEGREHAERLKDFANGRTWWVLTYDDGTTRRTAAFTEETARIVGRRPLNLYTGKRSEIVSCVDDGKVLP